MGKVMHFEIPAANMNRAKKFYAETFGWKTIQYPKMEYTIVQTAKTDSKGMISEKGVINGGMMKRTSKIKSPVITIVVGNIQKALSDVKKHGGKMLQDKTTVTGMGFAAYFKDSEGNIMGLFEPTRKM